MSSVDQVKARLDIVDLVSEYVPLKKAGRNYKALCPFHNENTPSFVVFPDTQSWKCFGQCGDGGDVFSFVMKREGWDFSETLRELAKRAGVELEPFNRASPEEQEAHARLYGLLTEAAHFFYDALPGSDAEPYIVSRGINLETADNFAIGYAPRGWSSLMDHLLNLGYSVDEIVEAGVATRNEKGKVYDRFRHRLMIPIRDTRERTIGFGARALDADQNPKYLNSPQGPLFDKSQLLFNMDRARRPIRETETAVIVEGYLDVMQADQAGFGNLVATMGTALTKDHIQQLSKYANRLILALDSDAAGMKATLRGLEMAREALGDGSTYVMDTSGMMQQAGRLKIDIRVLELPRGQDPDDFIRETPDRWPDRIAAALPLAEHLIKVGVATLPPDSSVMERERLAHELLPLLTATEDKTTNLQNIQLLSLKLRLDSKAMIEWAESQKRVKKAPLPSKARNGKMNRPQAPSKTHQPFPSMMAQGRMLEQYCLSVLLREPDRLYDANRLLREVGDVDPDTIGQPLQHADFTHSEFQAIFSLLQAAFRQDKQDPLDYMQEHADDTLRLTIDDILPEPLEAYANSAARLYVTELVSVQKEQQRVPREPRDDFPRQLLSLRRARIERQMKDITFELQEAEDAADDSRAQTCRLQSDRLQRACRAVNFAISNLP
jgi:DNA primase